MGSYWGVAGEKLSKTVLYGESGGSVVLIKTTGYRQLINYEPEGRAFESLRARQSDTNLGTSTEVPFFISKTASSRGGVHFVRTRISPAALRDTLLPRLISGQLRLAKAGAMPAACSGPVAVDGQKRAIFAA